MQLKVKQRVIKCYTNQLSAAFEIWKKQGNLKKRNFQSDTIKTYQTEQKELTNDILETQKVVDEKAKIKDCSNKRGMTKVFKRMERR